MYVYIIFISVISRVELHAELAIGNIVRRVLRSIREEEMLTDDILTGVNDEDSLQGYKPVSPAARNRLRAPSLHALIESVPISAAACHAAGEDSDLTGKCKIPPGFTFRIWKFLHMLIVDLASK